MPLVKPVVTSPVLVVTGRPDAGSTLGSAFAAAARAMALDEFFAFVGPTHNLARLPEVTV